MDDTENNLPEAAELSQPALDQAQPETQNDAPETDQPEQADENTQGVDPEAFEEVEYEGKKYALPPELKAALLRQSDYTRKTQELAQTRQQAEQTLAQQQARIEAERANIQAVARLTALDDELKKYESVDWLSLDLSDATVQQARARFEILKGQRRDFAEQVQQHEYQRAMQEQQVTARRLQEANEVLSREIKGWSPEYAQSLREVAKSLGAKDEHLDGIREPWIVKALHAQKVLAEMTKKAGTAAPAVTAKPVRTISGGNAKATVDPDKMSIEDWMRHEQRRMAAARR